MRKWIVLIFLILYMAANLNVAMGGDYGLDGAAPNSGDGYPDGSFL
ncbi:MAG: hypothetical protein KKD01_00795 [Proteobacteria bacterium]|nr:hypothetical protein [Pseudomonadota bacterium]MBU1419293.1 hypothetical protein [Pseudomonadota bacterium]MBU1453236.1 hypothetical protein [Pseudomonadota bacterium]